MKTKITVSIEIMAPIEKVWDTFNNPEANLVWNTGSPDWHTPKSEIDLKVWWKFSHTMSANDWSASFDFWWEYTNIEKYKLIKSRLWDNRDLEVKFEDLWEKVIVTETFEAEDINSIELQKAWWQWILNNFKNYVEKL